MFDKDFAQSLWCILECDKQKRNEIIEFLKRIPNELSESLSELLATINSREAMENNYSYEMEVIADDGFIYSYTLYFEEQEKTLILKQELATPENPDATYMNIGIELDLVKEYPPYIPEEGEEFHIGNFCNSIIVSPDFDTSKLFKSQLFMPFFNLEDNKRKCKGKELEMEIEYSLVQSALSTIVRRMHCNEKKIEDIPIDINELPLELDLDYIDKRYNAPSKKKNKFNK